MNEWNGRRKAQFTVQDVRSGEWRWLDRRDADDREARRQLEALASAEREGLRIGCASARMAERLSPLAESYGSSVVFYADDAGVLDSRETAAARESGAPLPGTPLPKLALVGLPDSGEGIRSMARLLLDAEGWAAISLFADRSAPRHAPLSLDRDGFARVYKRLRERGAWDARADGYLRETAESAGLPLPAVELAEQVFIELGFIRAEGAARTIEPQPPRRSLEESPRYRRMLREAESSSFPDWPLDRLAAWGKRIRREGPDPLPDSESADGV